MRLYLEDCATIEPEATRRIIKAELDAELVPRGGPGVTEVSIDCLGHVASIQVDDPITRKTTSRDVSLANVPYGSRPRLVALATAELVIATWAELEFPGTPTIEPMGPPAPSEAVEAANDVIREEMEARAASEAGRVGGVAREEAPNRQPTGNDERRRLAHRRRRELMRERVIAVAAVRGFVKHPGLLGGGGIRFGQELPLAFSWTLDALHEQGTIDLHANRFLVVSNSVAGSLSFHLASPVATFRGGAGLRVGVTNTELLNGSPALKESSVTPWGWPMATTSLSFLLGKRLLVEVAGESSYVMLATGGTQTGGASLMGLWIGAQAGLGCSW